MVTVVGSVADVGVTVLDLSDPVQPTGGFVYDIAVTNNGPSMAWRHPLGRAGRQRHLLVDQPGLSAER
ncbi:MAG: hypothetical protein R2873_06850 [Caldilineaceae bacterium]